MEENKKYKYNEYDGMYRTIVSVASISILVFGGTLLMILVTVLVAKILPDKLSSYAVFATSAFLPAILDSYVYIQLLLGEITSRFVIHKYCKSNNYINLKNILIKNKVGGYSYIENLIITPAGIIVLNKLSCTGYNIYVNQDKDYCEYVSIQKHGKPDIKQRINPLNKNNKCIQDVKELLNNEDIQYCNIIAYMDTGKLMEAKTTSENTRCIYVSNLIQTIEELVQNYNNQKLEINQINEISNKLYEANITDKIIRREKIYTKI